MKIHTLIIHKMNQKNKQKLLPLLNEQFNDVDKYFDVNNKIAIGKKISLKEIREVTRKTGRNLTRKCTSNVPKNQSNTGTINIDKEFIVESIDNNSIKQIYNHFKKLRLQGKNKQICLSTEFPKGLKTIFSNQEKNLKNYEKEVKKNKKLIKYLSSRTHKKEDQILLNSPDNFLFKTELTKTIANNNRYCQYKWNISLRRPDNFIGERKSYINLRTELNPYWAIIPEKIPSKTEIVIKPTNLNLKRIQSSRNKIFGNRSIERIKNLHSMNVKGEDLLEFEYKESLKLKGQKFIRKKIGTKNLFTLHDELSEKVFIENYDSRNYRTKSQTLSFFSEPTSLSKSTFKLHSVF